MRQELTRTQRIRHRNTDFKDLKLERQFVGGILKNVAALAKVIEELNSEAITSDRIRMIYDIAVSVYRETGEKLTVRSLKNELKIPDTKIKHFVRLYLRCKKEAIKATIADTISARKRLTQMFLARICEIGLKDIIGDFGKAVHQRDLSRVDEAVVKIERLHNSLRTGEISVVVFDPVEEYPDWKRKFKEIQEHPELLRNIPTGIGPIDNCMMGIRDSEVGLIIAETGVGKSIALMNICTFCWKNVGDAVLVTIEMPKEQYMNRWYCSLAGVDYNSFRRYELGQEEWNEVDKAIERAKKNEYKLHIIDMPEGCTAQAIKGEMEVISRKRNVRLLGIDYLNIMGNSSGAYGLSWEFQVQTAVEIKLGLARPLGMPVWTVAQSNADGNTAFATHIKDQVDMGVSFAKTDDYDATGMVRLGWFKTRDFAGTPTIIYTDRDHMQFWLDKSKKKKPGTLKRGRKIVV